VSSPQPNIFPKFLFHFADFPYELYIHQPEPAQLGNLLRFTVRARPGFKPKKAIFLRLHFQGAPQCTDLQESIVCQPGSCKKEQPLFRLAVASSRIESIPKTARRYGNEKTSPSFRVAVCKRLDYLLASPFQNQAISRYSNFNEFLFRGRGAKLVARLFTAVFRPPLNSRLTPIASSFIGNHFPLRSTRFCNSNSTCVFATKAKICT